LRKRSRIAGFIRVGVGIGIGVGSALFDSDSDTDPDFTDELGDAQLELE
jgi:hypothetical protein